MAVLKVSAIISIENGVLQNPKELVKAFKSLKNGRYLAEINSYNKRSNQQNRYYFGLVVPMIQKSINDLGHDFTKEEIHEWLKDKFNLKEVVNFNTGEYDYIPQSTTRLNKSDFSEYVDKIQRFAAEFLTLEIPDPGTQTELSI